MHVNTRWYCTSHFLQLDAGLGLVATPRDGHKVTCWGCYSDTGIPSMADDYVLQRL